jgi:hypothetical protein
MLAQTHVRQVSALRFPCRSCAALQHGTWPHHARADQVRADRQRRYRQRADQVRADHRGVDDECAENRGPG